MSFRIVVRAGLGLAVPALALAVAVAPAAAQAEVPMPVQRPADVRANEAAPPLSLAPAARTAAGATSLSGAAEAAVVQKINAYFNSMQALSGRFDQIGPDGSRTSGQFYIAKPGKVRFQYARPSPIEIIADGRSVAVRDRSLNTQDLYPLSQTPLRFLLKSDLALQRDATLVGVSRDADLVSVSIEEDSRVAGKSRLMMVLGGEPFQLKQWTITDAQGLDTTVLVSSLDPNARPDERLFQIDYLSDAMERR